MDAFYASCELRSRPDLRRQARSSSAATAPAASSPPRPTRPGAYGVHSAMPMSRAQAAVPAASIVLPPNFDALHRGVGRRDGDLPRHHPARRAALASTRRSSTSSGAIRRLGPPAVIAEPIRARVHDEQGITCTRRRRLDEVRGQAGLHPGQARRPARRARRPGHRLPAPAARRRAVGSGGEDRGVADPARAAHGRRRRQHPASTPSCARSAPRSASTWPRSPGAATRAAWRRPRPRRASATRRPSRATSTTPT